MYISKQEHENLARKPRNFKKKRQGPELPACLQIIVQMRLSVPMQR